MKKGLRLVAVTTLVCFLTTQCVSAAPGAGIEMVNKRELPAYLSIDVPADLGTVDSLYEAPAGANPQFILHIQNAHANYQAQMKIKQLLKYMNKKYGFKTIFVEGASEKLDPDYLRLFPDQERNLKLCDELAKQGELTGAELFLMEQGVRSKEYGEKTENGVRDTPYASRRTQGAEGAVEALGIEEAALYKANYDALKKVFGSAADVSRFFKGFDGKLDKVASQTFTPETRELIADWKRFEQGRREFMPFVKGLAARSKKILNVDLESLFAQVGWPQITRLLVIQQMEKDLNKAKGVEEQASLIKKLRSQGASKELIATLENFAEGSIAVGKSTREVSPREILERLAAEAGPKGFKFSDYPAFSLYAGYVTLRSELDPKVLFEEIEYLFTQMLDTLAREPEQKALLALYRDGELLRKLLHLELNRTQWRQLLQEKDLVAIPALVARLKEAVQDSAMRNAQRTTEKQNAATQDGSEKTLSVARSTLRSPNETTRDVMSPKFEKTMNELFTAGLEFYDYAHKREAVFYKEMQTAMAEKKITKAILITGGFHTDGMSDLFRENGISYGIVTPRLSEKSDENLYQQVMLQNRQYPFSVSYLEKVPLLISAGAMDAQGGNALAVYADYLNDVMNIGGVTLQGASDILNAALERHVQKIRAGGIPEGAIIGVRYDGNIQGVPHCTLIRYIRGASTTEMPVTVATLGGKVQVTMGQITPAVQPAVVSVPASGVSNVFGAMSSFFGSMLSFVGKLIPQLRLPLAAGLMALWILLPLSASARDIDVGPNATSWWYSPAKAVHGRVVHDARNPGQTVVHDGPAAAGVFSAGARINYLNFMIQFAEKGLAEAVANGNSELEKYFRDQLTSYRQEWASLLPNAARGPVVHDARNPGQTVVQDGPSDLGAFSAGSRIAYLVEMIQYAQAGLIKAIKAGDLATETYYRGQLASLRQEWAGLSRHAVPAGALPGSNGRSEVRDVAAYEADIRSRNRRVGAARQMSEEAMTAAENEPGTVEGGERRQPFRVTGFEKFRAALKALPAKEQKRLLKLSTGGLLEMFSPNFLDIRLKGFRYRAILDLLEKNGVIVPVALGSKGPIFSLTTDFDMVGDVSGSYTYKIIRAPFLEFLEDATEHTKVVDRANLLMLGALAGLLLFGSYEYGREAKGKQRLQERQVLVQIPNAEPIGAKTVLNVGDILVQLETRKKFVVVAIQSSFVDLVDLVELDPSGNPLDKTRHSEWRMHLKQRYMRVPQAQVRSEVRATEKTRVPDLPHEFRNEALGILADARAKALISNSANLGMELGRILNAWTTSPMTVGELRRLDIPEPFKSRLSQTLDSAIRGDVRGGAFVRSKVLGQVALPLENNGDGHQGFRLQRVRKDAPDITIFPANSSLIDLSNPGSDRITRIVVYLEGLQETQAFSFWLEQGKVLQLPGTNLRLTLLDGKKGKSVVIGFETSAEVGNIVLTPEELAQVITYLLDTRIPAGAAKQARSFVNNIIEQNEEGTVYAWLRHNASLVKDVPAVAKRLQILLDSIQRRALIEVSLSSAAKPPAEVNTGILTPAEEAFLTGNGRGPGFGALPMSLVRQLVERFPDFRREISGGFSTLNIKVYAPDNSGEFVIFDFPSSFSSTPIRVSYGNKTRTVALPDVRRIDAGTVHATLKDEEFQKLVADVPWLRAEVRVGRDVFDVSRTMASFVVAVGLFLRLMVTGFLDGMKAPAFYLTMAACGVVGFLFWKATDLVFRWMTGEMMDRVIAQLKQKHILSPTGEWLHGALLYIPKKDTDAFVETLRQRLSLFGNLPLTVDYSHPDSLAEAESAAVQMFQEKSRSQAWNGGVLLKLGTLPPSSAKDLAASLTYLQEHVMRNLMILTTDEALYQALEKSQIFNDMTAIDVTRAEVRTGLRNDLFQGVQVMASVIAPLWLFVISLPLGYLNGLTAFPFMGAFSVVLGVGGAVGYLQWRAVGRIYEGLNHIFERPSGRYQKLAPMSPVYEGVRDFVSGMVPFSIFVFSLLRWGSLLTGFTAFPFFATLGVVSLTGFGLFDLIRTGMDAGYKWMAGSTPVSKPAPESSMQLPRDAARINPQQGTVLQQPGVGDMWTRGTEIVRVEPTALEGKVASPELLSVVKRLVDELVNKSLKPTIRYRKVGKGETVDLTILSGERELARIGAEVEGSQQSVLVSVWIRAADGAWRAAGQELFSGAINPAGSQVSNLMKLLEQAPEVKALFSPRAEVRTGRVPEYHVAAEKMATGIELKITIIGEEETRQTQLIATSAKDLIAKVGSNDDLPLIPMQLLNEKDGYIQFGLGTDSRKRAHWNNPAEVQSALEHHLLLQKGNGYGTVYSYGMGRDPKTKIPTTMKLALDDSTEIEAKLKAPAQPNLARQELIYIVSKLGMGIGTIKMTVDAQFRITEGPSIGSVSEESNRADLQNVVFYFAPSTDEQKALNRTSAWGMKPLPASRAEVRSLPGVLRSLRSASAQQTPTVQAPAVLPEVAPQPFDVSVRQVIFEPIGTSYSNAQNVNLVDDIDFYGGKIPKEISLMVGGQRIVLQFDPLATRSKMAQEATVVANSGWADGSSHQLVYNAMSVGGRLFGQVSVEVYRDRPGSERERHNRVKAVAVTVDPVRASDAIQKAQTKELLGKVSTWLSAGFQVLPFDETNTVFGKVPVFGVRAEGTQSVEEGLTAYFSDEILSAIAGWSRGSVVRERLQQTKNLAGMEAIVGNINQYLSQKIAALSKIESWIGWGMIGSVLALSGVLFFFNPIGAIIGLAIATILFFSWMIVPTPYKRFVSLQAAWESRTKQIVNDLVQLQKLGDLSSISEALRPVIAITNPNTSDGPLKALLAANAHFLPGAPVLVLTSWQQKKLGYTIQDGGRGLPFKTVSVQSGRAEPLRRSVFGQTDFGIIGSIGLDLSKPEILSPVVETTSVALARTLAASEPAAVSTPPAGAAISPVLPLSEPRVSLVGEALVRETLSDLFKDQPTVFMPLMSFVLQGQPALLAKLVPSLTAQGVLDERGALAAPYARYAQKPLYSILEEHFQASERTGDFAGLYNVFQDFLNFEGEGVPAGSGKKVPAGSGEKVSADSIVTKLTSGQVEQGHAVVDFRDVAAFLADTHTLVQRKSRFGDNDFTITSTQYRGFELLVTVKSDLSYEVVWNGKPGFKKNPILKSSDRSQPIFFWLNNAIAMRLALAQAVNRTSQTPRSEVRLGGEQKIVRAAVESFNAQLPVALSGKVTAQVASNGDVLIATTGKGTIVVSGLRTLELQGDQMIITHLDSATGKPRTDTLPLVLPFEITKPMSVEAFAARLESAKVFRGSEMEVKAETMALMNPFAKVWLEKIGFADIGLNYSDGNADITHRVAFLVHGILDLRKLDAAKAAAAMDRLSALLGGETMAAVAKVVDLSTDALQVVLYVQDSGEVEGSLTSLIGLAVSHTSDQYRLALPQDVSEDDFRDAQAVARKRILEVDRKIPGLNLMDRIRVVRENALDLAKSQARRVSSVAENERGSFVTLRALSRNQLVVDRAFTNEAGNIAAANAGLVTLGHRVNGSDAARRYSTSAALLDASEFRELLKDLPIVKEERGLRITDRSIRDAGKRILEALQAVQSILQSA